LNWLVNPSRSGSVPDWDRLNCLSLSYKLHTHFAAKPAMVGSAIGSVEKPMTDQQLEAKFTDLADGIIPAPMIRRVMDACWNVENLPDAAEIAKMSVSA